MSAGASSQGALGQHAGTHEDVEHGAEPDVLREHAARGASATAGMRSAEPSMNLGHSGHSEEGVPAVMPGGLASPHASGSTADSDSELQRTMDDANNAAEELLRVRHTHGMLSIDPTEMRKRVHLVYVAW